MEFSQYIYSFCRFSKMLWMYFWGFGSTQKRAWIICFTSLAWKVLFSTPNDEILFSLWLVPVHSFLSREKSEMAQHNNWHIKVPHFFHFWSIFLSFLKRCFRWTIVAAASFLSSCFWFFWFSHLVHHLHSWRPCLHHFASICKKKNWISIQRDTYFAWTYISSLKFTFLSW